MRIEEQDLFIKYINCFKSDKRPFYRKVIWIKEIKEWGRIWKLRWFSITFKNYSQQILTYFWQYYLTMPFLNFTRYNILQLKVLNRNVYTMKCFRAIYIKKCFFFSFLLVSLLIKLQQNSTNQNKIETSELWSLFYKTFVHYLILSNHT